MSVTDVSIVAPVHGCAGTVDQLATEVLEAVGSLGRSVEVILIDDRSPDDVWVRIQRLAETDPRIVGIRLSRNFGQHAAITAGLRRATGGKVVVMDGDLQDPPALIPELLERSDSADVVIARRSGRYQSRPRLLLGRLYLWLVTILSGTPIDPAEGGFSVLDRKVVDAFLEFNEADRHYLFVVRWLGFSQVRVEYDRPERVVGVSSYNLSRRLRHAWSGIMFQSTRFLALVMAFGICVGLLGGLLGTYVIYQKVIGATAPGWASTVALGAFSFGGIIAVQGIVGLYIGRIFQEVKRRPYYVVDVTTDG
ncbi:MAG TPA: glycosyltransferase [Gemmatimonadetes bacterium]|nr:glycosyltransferase [Gemmatimonadota bacterium]